MLKKHRWGLWIFFLISFSSWVYASFYGLPWKKVAAAQTLKKEIEKNKLKPPLVKQQIDFLIIKFI